MRKLLDTWLSSIAREREEGRERERKRKREIDRERERERMRLLVRNLVLSSKPSKGNK